MATDRDESYLVRPPRIRIFVDHWNCQLSLNDNEANGKFELDWTGFADTLVDEASKIIKEQNTRYEGMTVFTSSDPATEQGKKHHRWASNWLDRQPGIQVKCFERQPKHPPKCPACYQHIEKCPHCDVVLRGTVEKGVDAAIVTDMIRLAWEKAYDVAILVSADADFVPAVEFLAQRGLKVIQVGVPPLGSHLSKACWATIDLKKIRERFRRVRTE